MLRRGRLPAAKDGGGQREEILLRMGHKLYVSLGRESEANSSLEEGTGSYVCVGKKKKKQKNFKWEI